MKDIIIVGGGPSGMTAALYALRANKSVLILEKENFGGQIANSPLVENFPTIQAISGLELSDKMFNQVTSLGAEFELEDVLKVEKINDKFVVTTNYRSYESKTVIFANGAKHKKMNLPNEDNLIGKGISFCALCDGPMYKGQEVFIIGDANTALQYALNLSDICSKVHLITLFDKFFADQILIDRIKARNNIEITHNFNLIEYKGIDELEGLVFEDTKTKDIHEFKTNNVFICIGQIPQNDKFSNIVNLEKGYILTNEKMETNTPGVYACGDTRKKDIRQVITACNDGAIAGVEAAKFVS